MPKSGNRIGGKDRYVECVWWNYGFSVLTIKKKTTRFMGRESASVSIAGKVSPDNMLFVLRKDKKKHDRAKALLEMQKTINEAKKQLKDPWAAFSSGNI